MISKSEEKLTVMSTNAGAKTGTDLLKDLERELEKEEAAPHRGLDAEMEIEMGGDEAERGIQWIGEVTKAIRGMTIHLTEARPQWYFLSPGKRPSLPAGSRQNYENEGSRRRTRTGGPSVSDEATEERTSDQKAGGRSCTSSFVFFEFIG